jgi:hypothetical protein
MHAALQSVFPGMQLSAHWPSEQTWPLGQAVPQAPQFSGSLEGSTQAPLQRLSPASQVRAQLLATQVNVPPPASTHFCPQPPQLSTSLVVSTQRAPQAV